jgi:hypothetical protein
MFFKLPKYLLASFSRFKLKTVISTGRFRVGLG